MPDRGVYNAGEVPDGHSCLLQTLEIKSPVTWRSSGSRQAQLLQLLGAAGSTVDGSRHAFILADAQNPANDPYQDAEAGQLAVGFNNISIVGGTNSQSVYVDGSLAAYTGDGLLFQNPSSNVNPVNAALQNLQVVNFPGNALSAYNFGGEFRGYNVSASKSGGSCVDLEQTANPYRIYGLVAFGCTIGLNMVKTKSEEFHGASVFKNGNIDISVTGTHIPGSYILFDGLQMGHSGNENMYLDQQNETVICAANCTFNGAGENICTISDCEAALVIGPDATTTAGGLTPIIAQFNQGIFNVKGANDIVFDTNANGKVCNCRVALGSGMLDIKTGTPSTNYQNLVSGQINYGSPQLGNAASFQTPLTLAPAELGIATSPPGTATAPGQSGLKLRVKCGTHSGKAKIVVLAGTSPTEMTLLDDIGGGVANCP